MKTLSRPLHRGVFHYWLGIPSQQLRSLNYPLLSCQMHRQKLLFEEAPNDNATVQPESKSWHLASVLSFPGICRLIFNYTINGKTTHKIWILGENQLPYIWAIYLWTKKTHLGNYYFLSTTSDKILLKGKEGLRWQKSHFEYSSDTQFIRIQNTVLATTNSFFLELFTLLYLIL